VLYGSGAGHETEQIDIPIAAGRDDDSLADSVIYQSAATAVVVVKSKATDCYGASLEVIRYLKGCRISDKNRNAFVIITVENKMGHSRSHNLFQPTAGHLEAVYRSTDGVMQIVIDLHHAGRCNAGILE